MKRAHLVLSLGAFIVFATISWMNTKDFQRQHAPEMKTLDLLSTSIAKVDREAVLPKTQIRPSNPKKEVDLRRKLVESDPALKHKWDMNLTQTLEAWQKHGLLDTSRIKVC